MAKKTKLGSKNPKYSTGTNSEEKVIKKKVHMCDAVVRDSSGNIKSGVTCPVHAVWYENDQIKIKATEKWWKLENTQLN